MKYSILFFLTIAFFSSISNNYLAQVPESCDCKVDTLGYAQFLETLNPNEDDVFQLHANQTFAIAWGTIGSSTPAIIQDLIDNHPEVTTIIMYACPGSEDDDANLVASQLIYNKGYKMYLPVDGWIASGAVDMFLTGSTRVIDATFNPVGVHSWSDGTNEATDFPVGSPEHSMFIDYYVSIGFSQEDAEDFYYYTINAAPAGDLYWMTDQEMDQYKIRTCKYSDLPIYMIYQSGNTLNTALSGASYQWFDCEDSNPIAGEENQEYSPDQDGSYSVFIMEDGCAGSTACLDIELVGITEPSNNYDIQVAPNPTSGSINITSLPTNNVSILILDIYGRELQYKSIVSNGSIQLNLGEAAGMYFVKIRYNEREKIVKLLKI